MISVHFQGKPFNITVIQVYAPATKAEEADQFCEDPEALLALKLKKGVLFITRDWNAKVGSQDVPLMGNFSLGEQHEAGQRLTEFCQETTLVIAKNLFQVIYSRFNLFFFLLFSFLR